MTWWYKEPGHLQQWYSLCWTESIRSPRMLKVPLPDASKSWCPDSHHQPTFVNFANCLLVLSTYICRKLITTFCCLQNHTYQGWGTRTRSTRVLNFWYSYCTLTRELQSDSTRTCTRTRGQVLRYSCKYWHEYWYSMVHLRCKGENHHICEINSMTYHTGKFQIDLFCYNLNIWYMGCDYKFHRFFQFYYHWKINWITIIMSMFIFVIHPSPVSHSTFG